MPGATFYQTDENAISGLPPVYAISVASLQGTYVPPDEMENIYSRFAKEQPFEVLNGTIYLYNSPAR